MAQTLFPKRREVQASYDWIDISDASGYIVFDGVKNYNATQTHILIKSSLINDLIPNSNTNLLNVSSTSAIDIDFDLEEFKLPIIIKGTSIFRCSIATDTALGSGEITVTFKVRKWDGSTETDLVSVSSVASTPSSNKEKGYILTADIPQTSFKKGEILRVSVGVAFAGNDCGLSFNPLDTAITPSGCAEITAGNSRLTVAIPFKIEV